MNGSAPGGTTPRGLQLYQKSIAKCHMDVTQFRSRDREMTDGLWGQDKPGHAGMLIRRTHPQNPTTQICRRRDAEWHDSQTGLPHSCSSG